jgi:hypothetical protein|tara:strand:+ start:1080 stop:1550 length:471 start_codon:yes stop_codon:yes gene_type:complete
MSSDDENIPEGDNEDVFDINEVLAEERLAEYIEEQIAEACNSGENYDIYPYMNDGALFNKTQNVDAAIISSFLSSYVKELEIRLKNAQPSKCRLISGSGPAYFYNPTTKEFVKVERGTEVSVSPEMELDSLGRVLAHDGVNYFMLPLDEIIFVGHN